jgi:3-hydroxyisobutyrate dehydrogenase-like beta-hydroxyacid dehydrogenase
MVKLAAKDVRLAVGLAKKQGFEALVGAGAQKTLEQAMAAGYADRDTAALMRIREDELGIKVRPASDSLKQVA